MQKILLKVLVVWNPKPKKRISIMSGDIISETFDHNGSDKELR